MSTERIATSRGPDHLSSRVFRRWGHSNPSILSFELECRPQRRFAENLSLREDQNVPYSIVISCPAHGKTLERVEQF